MYYFGYTTAMERSATKLQSLYRSRLTRRQFKVIMNAVRIMKSCESEYFKNPADITNICNYMVWKHVVLHDYEAALPLYNKAVEVMAARGPDVPFILLNYAIFLNVTQTEDLPAILEMVARAKAVDPKHRSFNMSHLGFYRQATILQPQSAQANLNYAICQQVFYF